MEAGQEERVAITQFLDFIQGCPLVGYYLEFDVAMVNQVIRHWLGVGLPNTKIVVSTLYHDFKYNHYALHAIDLSFNYILQDLNLPKLGQRHAFNDALMTALIYTKLQHKRAVNSNGQIKT